jgi:hypothetical protein
MSKKEMPSQATPKKEKTQTPDYMKDLQGALDVDQNIELVRRLAKDEEEERYVIYIDGPCGKGWREVDGAVFDDLKIFKTVSPDKPFGYHDWSEKVVEKLIEKGLIKDRSMESRFTVKFAKPAKEALKIIEDSLKK